MRNLLLDSAESPTHAHLTMCGPAVPTFWCCEHSPKRTASPGYAWVTPAGIRSCSNTFLEYATHFPSRRLLKLRAWLPSGMRPTSARASRTMLGEQPG